MTTDFSKTEIDTLLRESGVGVLALTDGTEAYSIPESFGYDGDTLYFQFVYTSDSKKMAFLETTETATFTVYNENPAQSVLVQGAIEPVTEANKVQAANAIAENASIPTMNMYPESTPREITMGYYCLTPTTVTGRKFDDFIPSPADQ